MLLLVVSKNILPEATYAKIKDLIVAKQTKKNEELGYDDASATDDGKRMDGDGVRR